MPYIAYSFRCRWVSLVFYPAGRLFRVLSPAGSLLQLAALANGKVLPGAQASIHAALPALRACAAEMKHRHSPGVAIGNGGKL